MLKLATILVLLSSVIFPQQAFADDAMARNDVDPIRSATEQAIARIKPALARIHVVSVQYSQGREVKRESSGSGFVIHKDGYLVTNHHVAARGTRIVCVFSDNEEIEATLVGADPLSDIAVLKLSTAKRKEFPVVDWGDSDDVAVGDTVLAMGSPLALSQSVTRGIVSNSKMTLPSMLRRRGGVSIDGEDVGSLVRWIAHDAPIYPGNSGGPLVDLSGRVIGVNEISLGLSGAIPSNVARDVTAQIIASGRVIRSWFGFEFQPLLKGSGLSRGALISGVVEGSPAEIAGFRSSDVLVELAGRDTTVRFHEELPLLNLSLAGLPVGEEFPAVVLRDGKEIRLRVRSAEREPSESRQREIKELGLTARNISSVAARERRLESRDGVLVTTTQPGGPAGAAKPNLQTGDILTTIAGQSVASLDDLVTIIAKLTGASRMPVPVVIGFRRRDEHLLAVVQVGIRSMEDPSIEARKAWLPVVVQVITRELASQMGTPGLTGVRITKTYPGAPPALQVGDLISEMDGEKILASQPGDEEVFSSLIRQRRIGDRAELTVHRAGRTLKVAAELVAAPKADREMPRFQDVNFEFSARDLSFFDRAREQLPDNIRGALVSEVKDGGWAALGELQVNDIIQSVAGRPIADADALAAAMSVLVKQRADRVLVVVRRGIRTLYLELEPSWRDGG